MADPEPSIDGESLRYNFLYFSYARGSSYIGLRLELEKFLEETRRKRGEDGKPLVKYPRNFDEVSSAMNRKDLVSNDSRLKYYHYFVNHRS